MAQIIYNINEAIWGPFTLILIVLIGIFLTIKTEFVQIAHPRYIWDNTIGSLLHSKKTDSSQGISPFQAVAAALAGSVGVGNIAGVASAIAVGGPGAVFWMWISAFFGMATKYSEIALAVKFRQTSRDGKHYGGPMFYIEKGLHCKPIAFIFALSGCFAGIGIGNITQSAEINTALHKLFNLPRSVEIFDKSINTSLLIGVCLVIIAGLSAFGGISKLSKVTQFFVPIMALCYILCCGFILILCGDKVGNAFAQIFSCAFNFRAAGGGVMGYTFSQAIKTGIIRGIFSNEAGLGSAPIAHASASTNSAHKQALWGIFEVFVDSFLICTVTALVVIIASNSSTYSQLISGGDLTARSFEYIIGGIGGAFVRISLIFFALSTIMGWSFYGEQCCSYITGGNKIAVVIYKIIFSASALIGTSFQAGIVWLLSDVFNACMTLPNVVSIAALSSEVEVPHESNRC